MFGTGRCALALRELLDVQGAVGEKSWVGDVADLMVVEEV